MPIFDLECSDCGYVFEFLFIRTDEFPTCSRCGSRYFNKLVSCPHIRMDSDALKSLPDPTPPLTELVGKTKPGCEGGFKEKGNDEQQLKNFDRKKDKYGNTIWNEKRRQYYHK